MIAIGRFIKRPATKPLVDGHDVEVWQRDRKVAVLPREPENIEPLTRLVPYRTGAVFMGDSNDRPELERRLNQARRMFDVALDPLTKGRLEQLIRDLEELLRPQK